MDKQGGRARRLQHARARQGDHHVHGGLMSDMHFSGMLINDIFSRSVASRAVPAAKLKLEPTQPMNMMQQLHRHSSM